MGDDARHRRWPGRLAVAAGCTLLVAGGAVFYAWYRGWLTATYLAASRPCGDLEAEVDLGYLSVRAGQVWAVRDGTVSDTTILDLSGDLSVEGEQGLLNLLVDATGEHLYAYLTDETGSMRLEAFPLDATGAPNPGGRRTIVTAELPDVFHNGGGLAFGPDGMLYVGVGDGGLIGDRHHYAQSKETLLGKVLRIFPDPAGKAPYRVPEGTRPFLGGDLPGRVDPVFEYPHEDGLCGVIGGVVVSDPSLPDLDGSYLVGDFRGGTLMALAPTGRGSVEVRDLRVDQPLITSIAADPDGRIWVLTASTASSTSAPPRCRRDAGPPGP